MWFKFEFRNQDRNEGKCFDDVSWGIGEVRDLHFEFDKIGESCSMNYKNPAN